MNTQTTEALIAEYDERISTRWQRCNLGSSRAASRQAKINALVDELGRRADEGDETAVRWYEET